MKSSMMNKGTPTPQIKDLLSAGKVANRHKVMSVSPRKDKPLGLDRVFGNAVPHEQRRDPYGDRGGEKAHGNPNCEED